MCGKPVEVVSARIACLRVVCFALGALSVVYRGGDADVAGLEAGGCSSNRSPRSKTKPRMPNGRIGYSRDPIILAQTDDAVRAPSRIC